MNLGEGLDEIGEWAFMKCTSLHEINAPPTVKTIRDYTFSPCSHLTIVNPGGLEEVGKGAFRKAHCFNASCIIIPRAVT